MMENPLQNWKKGSDMLEWFMQKVAELERILAF